METSYIYSASRVKALAKELLNESDLDRLLEVSRGGDFIKAVKETYISSYLEGDRVEDVFKALDKSLFEARKLISAIAPEANKFDWLWIRFDLHNLRLFIKAKKSNLNEDQILQHASYLGKYDPKVLFEHANNGTLNRLEPELVNIYEEALKMIEEKGVAEADLVIDKGYFTLAKRLVVGTRDLSLDKILRLQVDVHNIKTRLRTLLVNRTDETSWFIEGGNLSLSEVETKDQVMSTLNSLGELMFREAIEIYESEGHMTLLNLALDEYFVTKVRTFADDIFSPASLLLYFLQCQNSVKQLQTILIGKENGQSTEFIKKHLIKNYV